eukprot:symbB.v1.2.008432.t1/scaffold522.1/size192531/5
MRTAVSPKECSRVLLVDCNNVRGRGRGGRFDMTTAQFYLQLQHWVQECAIAENYPEVFAFFDHGHHLGGVQWPLEDATFRVAFSGPALLADDLLQIFARRWGAGRPVVAVTNDRRLRRRAAQQGLETPEAQWRRFQRQLRGQNGKNDVGGGFSLWVTVLPSDAFVDVLASELSPSTFPVELQQLHEEELEMRGEITLNSETRDVRRFAAGRLQEILEVTGGQSLGLQMKQLCAVLTGMQVSHNYEQGQQLLQSREFNTRKAFFQTVLEIGRRYKILNPERMRDSYGKLMYFLQDSHKPEVRDLLEFDIVSSVRSVWDVLKRSPKGTELLEDPQLKTATMEIMSEGKSRSQVQREIKAKEAAIKSLSSKYCSVARRRKRHYGGIYSTWNLLRSSYRDSDSEDGNDGDELSEDLVEQCIYSLGDHSTYLRFNREPCDRLIHFLKDFFSS